MDIITRCILTDSIDCSERADSDSMPSIEPPRRRVRRRPSSVKMTWDVEAAIEVPKEDKEIWA